jgi:hypothetical protein
MKGQYRAPSWLVSSLRTAHIIAGCGRVTYDDHVGFVDPHPKEAGPDAHDGGDEPSLVVDSSVPPATAGCTSVEHRCKVIRERAGFDE